MPESVARTQPLKLLSDLCRLAAERAPDEERIPREHEAQAQATEKHYRETLEQIDEQHEKDRSEAETRYGVEQLEITTRAEADHTAMRQEYERVRREADDHCTAEQEEAHRRNQQLQREARAQCEATRHAAATKLDEFSKQVEALWQEMVSTRQQAEDTLRRRRAWRELTLPPAPAASSSPPRERYRACVAEAQQHLQQLLIQSVPRLFEGAQPVGLLVALCLPVAIAAAVVGYNVSLLWGAATATAGLAGVVALFAWLFVLGRSQSIAEYQKLRQVFREAETLRPEVLNAAKAEYERLKNDLTAKRDAEFKKADVVLARVIEDLASRRQKEIDDADKFYPPRIAQVAVKQKQRLQTLEESYSVEHRELQQQYQQRRQQIEQEHQQAALQVEQEYQKQWNALSDRWHQGIQTFQTTLDDLNAECDARFPDWHTSDWQRWQMPTQIPDRIRFGSYTVGLQQIENGVPCDERLRIDRLEYSLPAFLPFPDRSTLLVNSDGEARGPSVQLLQSIMLRMLTALPPGKVRFTIIDPIGLGENFSAFMHLADYDELLVASRIWTDTSHIEKRLSDLTGHMENVLQVYLRNEFETIEQYNAFAGEMAEPYRVLVIANFPANFSEAAAHRLKSIVSSGPRCGVFTLMSFSPGVSLPRNFRMSDLKAHAQQLKWADGCFTSEHPDYGPLPLAFDTPPEPERFTEIVRNAGSLVQEHSRVEVPFESIIPTPDAWWTQDSRHGIDVPLGRAGAKKLQHLQLGKGTSQHVLVAGKTGSGKSTLLHALITNVALRYSPDEVNMYLIDFKKGVEFKAYASLDLPHAKVIAIESEREFGLSVLERLDRELQVRGDLFRQHGVQDLAAYRNALPTETMPRLLLIVDEFQELFTEDDRLAQNASLLLDRLVRQGRAFGIHVLLGSQTLGGAYTLARSTIGQMAVRIALQCSDADAHLILSEENTAARLLTRPGEAIYNDANGLFEGNHPFQIAWLSDEQREACLAQLRQQTEGYQVSGPPRIVFEGNSAAELTTNPELQETLAPTTWPEPTSQTKVWLGAAVAIKEPTAVSFLRHGGANLLMVGPHDEAATGLMASAMLGLAAQVSPRNGCGESVAQTPPAPKPESAPADDSFSAPLSFSFGESEPQPADDESDQRPLVNFVLLDGTRLDAPEAGYLPRLAERLPHSVDVVRPRDVPQAIGAIARELARRETAGEESGPPIFLLIHNLVRFRDLHRSDDDFGFGGLDGDKPPSPAKLLAAILRSGPPLGIHTIIWSDNYNNAMRVLDREGMREMEMRVVFSMNANDSSNLIDTPAASQLGMHRALLYDEGRGQLEKFRPYGMPSEECLAQIARQLHARGC